MESRVVGGGGGGGGGERERERETSLMHFNRQNIFKEHHAHR